MANKTLALLAILMILGSHVARSQKYFTNFNLDEGLSQSQVHSICQDSRGYLWIGTYGGGVNRYDGISFKQYTSKDGLGDNVVYAIAEDDRGNMWFGTDGGGVSVFNGSDFQKIRSEDGIESEHVYTIIRGKSGEMWVGTKGGGIYAIQYVVSPDQRYEVTHYGVNEGLVNDSVQSMIMDADGDLWVATESGVSWISFDFKEGNSAPFITYTFNFSVGNGLLNNFVNAVSEDHHGNIWFGTFGGGINIIRKESWEQMGGVVDVGSFKWNYLSTSNGLCDNRVTALYEDADGYMWIGTYGGGLCKILADSVTALNDRFVHYGGTGEFGKAIIWSLEQDRCGQIWIGTEGSGLYKYSGEQFSHFNREDGLGSDIVFSILESDDHRIWVGTYEGGINIINPPFNTGKLSVPVTEYNSSLGLIDDRVITLYEDTKGRIWAGTYGGICAFSDGKIHRLNVDELNGKTVLAIHESSKELLWVGTDDGGVFYFNMNALQTSGTDWSLERTNLEQISMEDGLLSNVVWTIAEDREGNIWLGTWAGGVSRLAPDYGSTNEYTIHNITAKDGLGNNSVLTILEDDYENMWFATYGGGISMLLHVDENISLSSHWQYITTSEGLTDDGVVSMTFDREGNIWAGTNKGVNKIVFDDNDLAGNIKRRKKNEPRRYHVKQYGKLEGFIGVECNQKAICSDRSGNIWFGTATTLSRYNAGYEDINEFAPAAHIRGLRLFFNEVDWMSRAGNLEIEKDTSAGAMPESETDNLNEPDKGITYQGFDHWNNVPQHLVLAYNNNHITFDFVGVNLKIPEKVRYRYMLKGLDADWSPPVKEHFATYPNLPPGAYTFMVKAVNNDGIWNSAPAMYEFSVAPPFWKTWWFYLVCALLLTASMYAIFLIRIRSLQKARKLLKQQVRLRTRELRAEKVLVEKQKVELEIANNDLNQAYNKLKQLEAFKDSMMGMVVHDLKNPLNTILNFSKYRPTEGIMANIYRAGRKMLNMVMNILDIQKFEEADMHLSVKTYFISDLVDEAVEEVAAIADEKAVAIEKDVSGSTAALFDFDVISRVLVNLLTNAVKFTPSEGSITIRAVAAEDHPEMVNLSVMDTGSGIAEDMLNVVFERFSQIESRNLGVAASTGIGLTFCKLAVEAHGGAIGVSSTQGKGSTFYFTLPHASPQDAEIRNEATDSVPISRFSGAGDREETAIPLELPEETTTFTTEDKAYFKPFLHQLEEISVFHTSEVNGILDKMNNEQIAGLRKWKSDMEKAMYGCHENKWNALLNMIR